MFQRQPNGCRLFINKKTSRPNEAAARDMAERVSLERYLLIIFSSFCF